jgi:hypothetical protein
MADAKSALDEYFPRDHVTAEVTLPTPMAKRLGIIVAGSLSKGLDIKLDRDARIEDTAVGRYVVVQSGDYRFFSLITDVALDSTHLLIGAERGRGRTQAGQDGAEPFCARFRGHGQRREPYLWRGATRLL